jgi:hypothetical protein
VVRAIGFTCGGRSKLMVAVDDARMIESFRTMRSSISVTQAIPNVSLAYSVFPISSAQHAKVVSNKFRPSTSCAAGLFFL